MAHTSQDTVDMTGALTMRQTWSNATGTDDPTPAGCTTTDGDGNVLATRPLTDAETGQLTAMDTAATLTQLQDAARSAVTVNDAFLALPAPTTAQIRTQVQHLTQEITGLIRIIVGHLDSNST